MAICIWKFAIISFCIFNIFVNGKERRILANDPSFTEQRLAHLESLVQQQQLEISQLKSQVQSGSSQSFGAVFIRWGQNYCPNSTETVYAGYAGGGYYSNTGAPPNHLCMPPNPKIGPDAGTSDVNYVYGVEYETNFWKTGSQDEDVPCAVCRSPRHTSALMIPATDQCFQGWTSQYTGRLASSYHSHGSGKNYICVDKNPSFILGGSRNTEGALLYPVVSECGALPCPPYKSDKVVLCVICTK